MQNPLRVHTGPKTMTLEDRSQMAGRSILAKTVRVAYGGA